MELMVCPGADDAIIGTFVNEHGVTVPVYDIPKVIDLFGTKGQSVDAAVAWMEGILRDWDEHIRPMFIEYDPSLGSVVKKSKKAAN